jgi:hypothetical protein
MCLVPAVTIIAASMPRYVVAMNTALRVLNAVIAHDPPNPADLQELHRFAPELAHLPPDECARAIIERGLEMQVFFDPEHQQSD